MKFGKLLVASFLLSSALASDALAIKIKKIEVEGNKRVEKSTIVNYLPIKKGDEFKQENHSEIIKKLYSTNLFDDVIVKFKNGNLQISVSETPLVSKVVFNGNTKVKTSLLKKETLIHQGSSLNKSAINADIDKIKYLYRISGRYAIQVTASVEELGNNRAKVTYNIVEGPKTSVRYINFVGNHAYKDSELKSIILTKESAWFRFLDSSDTYDPQKLDYDKHLLKNFYTSVGYADARVVSGVAQLAKTKEYFTITYTVDEGEIYNFGNISIESNIDEIDPTLFEKLITIKDGQRYSSAKIEAIIENINNKLADMGYSGAVTYHGEDKETKERLVDVKFVIDKGSKTFINKINIRGNLKTRDHVIRRQLPINEGDLFNRSQINKGEMNIRNLDYFETVNVNVDPVEGSNNKVDLNVDVLDKSTSSIQFEIGYNSVDGPVGRVNFVERNLLGSGQYFSAGVDRYKKKTSYHMGITDPYFMDRDLLVGASFFNMNSNGSGDTPYKIISLGGSLRAGYEVATDLRHDINYTYKTDKLSGVTGKEFSVFIQEQFGRFQTSSISNSLTYDKTDSSIVPKNGYITSFTQTTAGVGGDIKYTKNEADFSAYKSFVDNKYTIRLALAAGNIMGYGGQKVRISERFNLGDFSMRGFESSGIGPRTKTTNEGLGGQNFYTATAELMFPVGLPKEFNVSGSVFTDVGALWGFDIRKPDLISKKDVYNTTKPRVSVGAGILWVTRFAPIRLDYAVPIEKQKYDKTQRWHFRFSTSL